MNAQTYIPVDQASHLRAVMQPAPAGLPLFREGHRTRVIAIGSGKGGVGKTNLSVNLALILAQGGKRVWLLDADMGLANIDVVMGLQPDYTLGHVLTGQKSLREIMIVGARGLQIIPGASGLADLANLPSSAQERLLREVAALGEQADILLVDTGAGIGPNVLRFLRAAHEVIIITTPEPTAITDCYALVKVLAGSRPIPTLNLVVNWARNSKDADVTARKLVALFHRFLNVEVTILGALPEDEHLAYAVRKQTPLVLSYPRSPYAMEVRKLGQKLGVQAPSDNAVSPLRKFFQSMSGFTSAQRLFAVES